MPPKTRSSTPARNTSASEAARKKQEEEERKRQEEARRKRQEEASRKRPASRPNDGDHEINRVKNGGIEGCLGLDQINWGGEAGRCYECWRINPCCGSPDAKNMFCCFVCWFCCHCCAMSKLYATSVNQRCAIIPHCLMAWCLPCITSILVRNNLRKRLGVRGNICGDIICVWCCGPCAHCQECRSVSRSGWNLLEPSMTIPEIMSPQIIFTR